MENKKLILNIEYFLQCAGNCAGCFLTRQERDSSQVFNNLLLDKIQFVLNKSNLENEDNIIIGFGRGNILNLDYNELDLLLNLIDQIEVKYANINIKYEVSTSLIGKLPLMVERAKYLINKNRNIYFNIVINSEIASQNFWNNYQTFYRELSEQRYSWGLTDETGDILVLNINPESLPNIDNLKSYFQQNGKYNGSPFNISVFPFTNSVSDNSLKELSNWLLELYEKTKGFDLNIKNIIEGVIKTSNFSSLEDIVNYHNYGKGSYYFISKNGDIIDGHFSTMGEVDYPRLLEKYKIDPEIRNAIKTFNKNKVCMFCEHKNTCLLTGAYLSAIANIGIGAKNLCPNGYQGLFEKITSDLDASAS